MRKIILLLSIITGLFAMKPSEIMSYDKKYSFDKPDISNKEKVNYYLESDKYIGFICNDEKVIFKKYMYIVYTEDDYYFVDSQYNSKSYKVNKCKPVKLER